MAIEVIFQCILLFRVYGQGSSRSFNGICVLKIGEKESQIMAIYTWVNISNMMADNEDVQ